MAFIPKMPLMARFVMLVLSTPSASELKRIRTSVVLEGIIGLLSARFDDVVRDHIAREILVQAVLRITISLTAIISHEQPTYSLSIDPSPLNRA